VSYFRFFFGWPFERRHLPPSSKKTFDYEESQARCLSIYMGIGKKMVIADTCAAYYFRQLYAHEFWSLVLGAVYFAFRFTAIQDMARMSKLFRWIYFEILIIHFSRILPSFGAVAYILVSWFRGLFIYSVGSKGSKMKQVRNVFIIL
jgi:hypothetical protein